MKIPNKVRLNGVDFTVEWIENLHDAGVICDGLINYQHSMIALNTETQGYQKQCITFLHEICHGILDAYDCSPEGRIKSKIPDDEETLVELFARGFYQFLQDNGAALFDLKKEESGNDQTD